MSDDVRLECPFGIGDPRGRGSEEIVDVAETFADAVKKWERLREREPRVGFYITGWAHGVLAYSDEIDKLFATPRGTFECPLCGQDTPHTHNQAEVEADRKIEAELRVDRDKKRAEILRRAENVTAMYGLPRKMVPGDIGL